MSAIARYFMHEGHRVAGYDRTPSPLTRELEAEGAAIHYTDDIKLIGEDMLGEFLKKVKEQSLFEEKTDLKIVYTPLHGTGNIPVRKMLEGMNVTVVKEQEMPDGNFSTVRSPNPEEKDALNMAIEKAKEIGIDFYEVIQHEGRNVNEVFQQLTDKIIEPKPMEINEIETKKSSKDQ